MTKTFPPLIVLNPGGRDADQDFSDFAGSPSLTAHAPVNFHGFAAATGGAFVSSVKSALARNGRNVLLLLRPDLKTGLRAMEALQAEGRNVYIAFKECGWHQVTACMVRPNNAALLAELARKCSGAVAVTEDLRGIYRTLGATNIPFAATPYPVEDVRWDFSVPINERRGIFIGTREFDVPTRNHTAAVITAFSLASAGETGVTVFNEDGSRGRRLLEDLAKGWPGVQLTILQGRKAYPQYLTEMARHRIVFQLDGSSVPGQVAGDALLCRIPCVGGNGTTERLTFPALTSHGRSLPELREMAERLLTNDAFYEEQVSTSQALAVEKIGFQSTRESLASFLSA